MNRAIIDVLVSCKGNEVNIYDVENPNLSKGDLKEGSIYEVTYRLGERGRDTFTSKYLGATENFRSLRFEHPTKGDRYSIYVPFNNILEFNKIY